MTKEKVKKTKSKTKLTTYLKGLWVPAIIGSFGMVIEALCQLLLPKLMGVIIDNGVTPVLNGTMNEADGRAYILKEAILMILIALVAIAGGVFCMYESSIVSQKYAYKIRNAMFDKIAKFSFANIDKFSTASLTTRVTTDVTTVQNMTMMILRMLIRGPSLLIIASFFAITISPRLALIILMVLPFIAVAVVVIMKYGFPMFQKMQKRIDNLNRVVQENLIGIRVVKAFVREEDEKKKFKQANDALSKQGARASGLIIIAMPVMMLLFNLTVVAVLYNGGIQVSTGDLSTGELISFISYVSEILMSMMMLAMILLQVARGKACADRIKEVLDTESEMKDNKDSDLKVTAGKIEFKNVDFRYSDQTDGDDILTNISFTAEPGQVIGIVGSTGCGKSSLVSLIPRLYDVTRGSVLIDGADVRDYGMTALRDSIGVVLQKNTLFTGTIKENIKWGCPDATDDEIIEACKAAQAHDFIMSFPDGYDTVLAQGGLNLSGGQKQRLCIARAMIKKPKILILDDSTSAVDTATEAKIRKSFYTNLKDTTVIIIAQRINSVAEADKILVMDDGQIKGEGVHSELIESNTIYKEIYTTQLKGVGE
ncbi:MAG: ABC transporter ATP-binding protein/permease [Clostridiales bacterium]|nr:ABC transporter ATP-binding protein/permease [Clostridiales bacterium]